MAKTLPVIEESFQMSYVGGGDGTSASPYTQAEFDSMCSSDNWNGGYVEGMVMMCMLMEIGTNIL